MGSFSDKIVNSWSDFIKTAEEHRKDGNWIYRGQECSKWPLRSSLERALDSWKEDLRRGAAIERAMIRDFRRRYTGDHSIIDEDTLHCLALMQHHGAPTRLLDWT